MQHRMLVTVVFVALAGSGCENSVAPDVPHCLAPAPLIGQFEPAAPGFYVSYRDGTDATAETSRLAARYHFTPSGVYPELAGFSATLDPVALAGVRCDRSVEFVRYDTILFVD